jgi:hypothetical protein
MIEDMGRVYCDHCYANEDNDRDAQLVTAEHELENEDYVDMELMDLLDSDDDDGLF